MAAASSPQIEPRKQPVQARSAATVEALYEASIQVLLASGYRKLTTTRVAERAGVSVGSLYQYFPNREALITAVTERHLQDVIAIIERRCREVAGRRLEEMVTGMIDAVVAAKWENLEISRALHEPMAEIRGAQCVNDAAVKMAQPVADILRSCSDAAFIEAERLAYLIVIACSALLQAAITGQGSHLGSAFDPDTLRVHLRAMVLGYLREMSVPDVSGAQSSQGREIGP